MHASCSVTCVSGFLSDAGSFLAFRSQITKSYKSQTARMLCSSIAIALFMVQMMIFVPSILTQHQYAVTQSLNVQTGLISSALSTSDPEALSLSDSVLGDKLVGLVLLNERGRLILNIGNTLEFSLENELPQPSGHIKIAVNQLNLRSGSITAIAFVDTRSALFGSVVKLLLYTLLAAFIGVAAALIGFWGVFRFYILPMELLIERLRNSRQMSNGGVPQPIDVGEHNDLSPIADEFNSLIEQQRESNRQVRVKQQYLEFAAHHDPLTHLPNRLMFETELKNTVQHAMANRLQFAVFLVDIDNFKYFNDQYGHLVGDKMVAEIGNRLRSMMRDIDVVGRLDGDEFVVIQKEVKDPSSAEQVARRIMKAATAPYEYRGFTLKAAVSVGISCFPMDVHLKQKQELLGEEIVNNAAVALQESKSNGKNQYQRFDEKIRRRLTARIRLEQDLKMALQDGQFEVYYQPKINIHTRQCTGSEALVRWRHPVNGFVSPDAFVPVAEETGLIIELGEWILETACEMTRDLQLAGYGGLNVAVNISAVQFADGGLFPMVRKALERTQLSPDSLELEITESAVMHDPEDVIRSLHELSQFGMRLAIDDFGTGYSSLAYLKRFPVNTLKIDRAFITDISNDNDDVAIVEAVLGLGQHFNMKVVAEGVEDEEQLSFLKSQGCDIAQGYFISKPLSSEQYVQWLERWPYGVQGSPVATILELSADSQRTGSL